MYGGSLYTKKPQKTLPLHKIFYLKEPLQNNYSVHVHSY